MTTLTIAAAELRRIALAVEKSAAKDDSRPVLAGIHASIKGDRLTLAAADGFRLSTAHATLDESAATDATAILERAGLLAFAKSLKPKSYAHATIDVDAAAWTFAANGTRAAVRLIDGAYPDFQTIVGSGDEPVLFAVNPQYFANVLASHGSEVVTVSRANDDATAPLFFSAEDGTRHVVMPMVVSSPSAEWKRREDAAPVPVAAEVEPAPAPVTPAESAYRTRDAAAERRDAKRAARRAADAGTVARDAPVCATCNTHASPSDNFCGECGSPFGEPAPVAITRPVATPYALAAYSPKNQERILSQCPDATDVRGFHAWLKAGHVVRKGQKGIKIIAPVMGSGDGTPKVVNIKPAYVFDVSQTDERTGRIAA